MTTPERPAAFYNLRDQRTLEYGAPPAALEARVAVTVGADVARCRTGQVAVLTLINLLARVHRHLRVAVPNAALIAIPVFGGNTFPSAIEACARAITPVLDLEVAVGDCEARGLRIAVCPPSGTDARLQVGWSGGRADVDPDAEVVAGGSDDDLVGALTAACLAAAATFRLAGGNVVAATRLNLVESTEGPAAGESTVAGPIDLGNVLVIGAGAVSQALLYFTRYLGTGGSWDVVDGDNAELHNDNRCMLMTAADGGWNPLTADDSGPVEAKARCAVRGSDAIPHVHWYDEWPSGAAPRPDVVLTLANERGVRAFVAERGEPLLLHATTSADWTAELHRHIAGRDDCPACRLDTNRSAAPTFACSTAPADPGGANSGDAALPFLSAMAGLLLTVELALLSQGAATRLHGPENHWRLHLRLKHRLWQTSSWPNHCPHGVPASVVAARRAGLPPWAAQLPAAE